MSLTVEQESRYEGKDWWKWAVWLEGPHKELNEVDHVTYTLHPTFSPPVARVDNRKSGFRLESAGWGEFEIHQALSYKNGTTRKRKHWLTLEYPAKERGRAGSRAPEKKADETLGPVLFLSSGAADLTLARRSKG